mmetsp:Transcript_8268/g.7675  ORF Transcript_8268/g.7675 Transcript_8268/m.7675 type:complete len:136 (-) Transcript_8268:155-562(-)
MLVRKQAIANHASVHKPLTYLELLKDSSGFNPLRLFTLGMIPAFVRNSILGAAVLTGDHGVCYTPFNSILVLGALALSHPFELAKIKCQYEHGNSLFGPSWNILKEAYGREGLGGLYRGFIPRAMFMFPLLLTII